MSYQTIPPPKNHPLAVPSLVTGIVGVLFCGLLGPVAWVLGSRAVRQIDASPGAYDGRDVALAGRIIGIIATALWGLLGLLFLVILGPAFWSIYEAFDGRL